MTDANSKRASRRTIVARIPLFSAGCLLVFIGLLIGFSGEGMGWVAIAVVSGLMAILFSWRATTAVLLKLYLASFSGMAVFVAIEVVCRVVLPIPEIFIGDWAGAPGSRLVLTSAPDDFTAVHRYNSLGFRGPQVSIKPEQEMRVVCIGDSYTEGIGAQEQETWPAVLQNELSSLDCDVINLGDAGSPPDRYLRILSEVGIALRPTHVVICLIPSDLIGGPIVPTDLVPQTELHDAFHERGSRIKNLAVRLFPGWIYLWDRSRGRLGSREGKFWSEWNELRSDTMIEEISKREQVSEVEARQIVAQRMANISPECQQAANDGEFNGARIIVEVIRPYAAFKNSVADMEISEPELKRSTRAWIQWYADTCRQHDITPIVAFFPHAGLVSATPHGPVSDENLVGRPDQSTDNSLSELLQALCLTTNCKYIDCTPALRQYDGDQRLYLRYDGHPTTTAYEIAGSYIADVFKQDFFAVKDDLTAQD